MDEETIDKCQHIVLLGSIKIRLGKIKVYKISIIYTRGKIK
jgi:hypothetical protein